MKFFWIVKRAKKQNKKHFCYFLSIYLCSWKGGSGKRMKERKKPEIYTLYKTCLGSWDVTAGKKTKQKTTTTEKFLISSKGFLHCWKKFPLVKTWLKSPILRFLGPWKCSSGKNIYFPQKVSGFLKWFFWFKKHHNNYLKNCSSARSVTVVMFPNCSSESSHNEQQ